jgi:hypothetical protein
LLIALRAGAAAAGERVELERVAISFNSFNDTHANLNESERV